LGILLGGSASHLRDADIIYLPREEQFAGALGLSERINSIPVLS
jgi:hypothetical protein